MNCEGIIIIVVTWQLTAQEKVGSFWWPPNKSTAYVFLYCTSHKAPGSRNTCISKCPADIRQLKSAEVKDN